MLKIFIKLNLESLNFLVQNETFLFGKLSTANQHLYGLVSGCLKSSQVWIHRGFWLIRVFTIVCIDNEIDNTNLLFALIIIKKTKLTGHVSPCQLTIRLCTCSLGTEWNPPAWWCQPAWRHSLHATWHEGWHCYSPHCRDILLLSECHPHTDPTALDC